jgi:hypothetical protein
VIILNSSPVLVPTEVVRELESGAALDDLKARRVARENKNSKRRQIDDVILR